VANGAQPDLGVRVGFASETGKRAANEDYVAACHGQPGTLHRDVVAAAVQQLLAHAHEEAVPDDEPARRDRVAPAQPDGEREQEQQEDDRRRRAPQQHDLPHLGDASGEEADAACRGDQGEARPEHRARVRPQAGDDPLGRWRGRTLRRAAHVSH